MKRRLRGTDVSHVGASTWHYRGGLKGSAAATKSSALSAMGSRLGLIGTVFALGLFVFSTTQVQARYASIVVDADTSEVLHEVNADTRNYPASLVKMMTLYMVFEALEDGRLRCDQALKVSRYGASMIPSRLGLKAGQSIQVEDAILALVTKSANDAAVALGEALGGTEAEFARMMTERAGELGMTQSTFRNASGLPDRRQLSTARDMATLAQALLREFPQYYNYFSKTEFRYNRRTYKNHNRLLKTYAGTDGIKTGYTRASGYNLVASVKRDGRRLVAVVFGGKTARTRNRHMVKLLDRGFAKAAILASADEASPEANGATKQVALAEQPLTHHYGVQVGAYYRYSRAERAAVDAARRLRGLLSTTSVWVPQIQGKRGDLFLARLVGISKRHAFEACNQLKAINIDCLVVKLDKAVKLALDESEYRAKGRNARSDFEQEAAWVSLRATS